MPIAVQNTKLCNWREHALHAVAHRHKAICGEGFSPLTQGDQIGSTLHGPQRNKPSDTVSSCKHPMHWVAPPADLAIPGHHKETGCCGTNFSDRAMACMHPLLGPLATFPANAACTGWLWPGHSLAHHLPACKPQASRMCACLLKSDAAGG